MQLSTLISKLEEIKKEHGDIDAAVTGRGGYDYDIYTELEEDTDLNKPVLLLE